MEDQNKVNCEDNIPNKHLFPTNNIPNKHLSNYKLKEKAISNEIREVFNQPLETPRTKWRKVRLLVDEQKKLMRNLSFPSTNKAFYFLCFWLLSLDMWRHCSVVQGNSKKN